MRLTGPLKQTLLRCAQNSFGPVDVYLFGSRVDDHKTGGDIDLAIDLDCSRTEFRKKKFDFLTALIMEDLEIKVDVVPYHPNNALLAEEIHNTAVKLNSDEG